MDSKTLLARALPGIPPEMSVEESLSEMVLREQRDHSLSSLVNVRDMEHINISPQHLARLIGDVLDLASSEAGQLHILQEPLELAEVLQVAAKISNKHNHH